MAEWRTWLSSNAPINAHYVILADWRLSTELGQPRDSERRVRSFPLRSAPHIDSRKQYDGLQNGYVSSLTLFVAIETQRSKKRPTASCEQGVDQPPKQEAASSRRRPVSLAAYNCVRARDISAWSCVRAHWRTPSIWPATLLLCSVMFLSITAVILITILVGLLGVFWILSRGRPRHKTKTVSKASSPPPLSNGAATRSSGDHVPPGHPKVDPIHQFADGEKDAVPFTCPFMAAFKEVKKKEDAKEEEEAPVANAVLEQFSDMMAGYEEFRRNKEMAAAKAEDGKCVEESYLLFCMIQYQFS